VEYLSKISLAQDLGEFPWEKRERYKKSYAKAEDVETLLQNPSLGELFEKAIESGADGKISANYITSDLMGLIEGDARDIEFKFRGVKFANLMKMVGRGEIGSRGAKDILAIMYLNGGDPEIIAKKEKLFQKSDEGELKKIVEKIFKENPSVVEDYKSGKGSAMQFLVGQGMKETKGSANPQVLAKLFEEMI